MSFVIYQSVITLSAWQRGYNAYYNTSTQAGNPYKQGTQRHSEWNEGWEEGKIDAQIKQEEEEFYAINS